MTAGNFAFFLPLLVDAGVRFVLIGGGAGIAHGLGRATFDVDVVYERSSENLHRIAQALATVNPYLRNAPPGLPFRLDEATLKAGLNFTLTTDRGDLDLLGEVAGGGTYDRLIEQSKLTHLYDCDVHVVNLETLVRLKRAAGRPKDFESLAELTALLRHERGEEDLRDAPPPRF